MLDFHWIKFKISPIFPSSWYFFPRHFKCRGIFPKYNGRWENTMSKNTS